MAHTISESSTFTASISVPDGGDPIRSADVENYVQGLANRTQYLKDRFGDLAADANGELSYVDSSGVAAPKTRTVSISCVHATSTITSAGSSNWYFDGLQWKSRANTSILVFDLKSHLPNGAVVTNIVASVIPGSARATVGERVILSALFVHSDGSTDAYNVTDDGTANAQELDASDDGTWSDVTVDETISAALARVQSGVDGASNQDTVTEFAVTFLDPGPRNY